MFVSSLRYLASTALALLVLYLSNPAASVHAQTQQVRVPIRVEGKEYTLSFPATTPLADASRDFCRQGASTFGLQTEEDLVSCVNNVFAYLRQTLVPIRVEGKEYTLSFPATTPLADASRDFCRQGASTFGLQTEEDLAACVNNVFAYLRQTLAAKQTAPAQSQPLMYNVPLTVEGKQYEIGFRSNVSFVDAARSFCGKEVAALGLQTEDDLRTCIVRVGNYLQSSISAALARRNASTGAERVSVPIRVEGKEYTLSFPATTPLADASRDFCRQGASIFGLQTEEDLAACANNVFAYLRQTLVTPAAK